MNLEQLHALVWVARLRGFAAAAGKLNTTQPGISMRIRKLEQELGVTLFERTRRSVSLTPKGRDCVEFAERILGMVSDMHTQVGTEDSLAGTVKMGVGESIAMTWLPDLMSRLDRRYPNLSVDLEIGLTFPLIERLESGEFDVVLVGGAADSLGKLRSTSEYLGALEFAWMSAQDNGDFTHPLTPKDLESQRILTFSKSAAIYRVVDEWFVKNGAYPQRRSMCDSMMSLAALTMARVGIGLLPVYLFQGEIAQGKLRIIPTEPPITPFHYHAMYLPTRWSTLARAIAETAAEVSRFPRSLPG